MMIAVRWCVALALGWPGVFDYPGGYAESLETGRPLAVFVGCPPLRIPGVVMAYRSDPLPGMDGPGVALAVPRGGFLEWIRTLPPTADLEEIRAGFRTPGPLATGQSAPRVGAGCPT